MTLELYDTTFGSGARDSRCVFALPEGSRVHLPEVFPSYFCPSPSSTFYKRPEDRILSIFHASGRTGITLIVVFVSSLLHFFEPGRFVKWDEWEKYTWIVGPEESATLHSPQTFISSSGFLHYRPGGRQRLRVTVTSFLPSTEAKYLSATGPTHDGRGEHIPLPVAASKREFNIHDEAEGLWEAQVMMTEDNILILPVRRSPKQCPDSYVQTIADVRKLRGPVENSVILKDAGPRRGILLVVGRSLTLQWIMTYC